MPACRYGISRRPDPQPASSTGWPLRSIVRPEANNVGTTLGLRPAGGNQSVVELLFGPSRPNT